MTNFYLFDKFMKSIEEPRDFKWENFWDHLIGLEKYTDFTKELTDLKNIETFSETKNNFTGFLTGGKKGKFDFYSGDYDYLFFMNGKIRYLQYNGGKDFLQPKKQIFYNSNFCITQTYSEKDSLLKNVELNAGFCLDDLSIEYYREKKNEGTIFVYNDYSLYFYFSIEGTKADYLTTEIFKDYTKFKMKFNNAKGNLSSGKKHDDEMYFWEAMRILVNS